MRLDNAKINDIDYPVNIIKKNNKNYLILKYLK